MRLIAVRFALALALLGMALAPTILRADDEAEVKPTAPVEAKSTSSPSIGSWLNTPPDRQAVAFDANFNRLYFNAEGKVVGRYNRLQKKFQAGDYYPAQWHNIGTNEKTAPSSPSTSIANGNASGDSGSSTRDPDVPYPPNAEANTPEPLQPKPAEIFRRGQASSGGGTRARIIEAFKP